MLIISCWNIIYSNTLEMRKLDLIRNGDDLYEVIQRYSVFRFTKEVSGENADILKQWVGAEKILRDSQRNEYLFVNKIEEAKIID